MITPLGAVCLLAVAGLLMLTGALLLIRAGHRGPGRRDAGLRVLADGDDVIEPDTDPIPFGVDVDSGLAGDALFMPNTPVDATRQFRMPRQATTYIRGELSPDHPHPGDNWGPIHRGGE